MIVAMLAERAHLMQISRSVGYRLNWELIEFLDIVAASVIQLLIVISWKFDRSCFIFNIATLVVLGHVAGDWTKLFKSVTH